MFIQGIVLTMKSEQIHDLVINDACLRPKRRSDGWSYWTHETASEKSIRILRVSQHSDGSIAEVKLAVSSNRQREDVFLAPPYTEARLRDAIAGEVAGLR
jgi:hypothetical protein